MKKWLTCLLVLSLGMAVPVSIEAGKNKPKNKQRKKAAAKSKRKKGTLGQKLKKFDKYLKHEIDKALSPAGEPCPVFMKGPNTFRFYVYNALLSYIFLFDWMSKVAADLIECSTVSGALARDFQRRFQGEHSHLYADMVMTLNNLNTQGLDYQGQRLVKLYQDLTPLYERSNASIDKHQKEAYEELGTFLYMLENKKSEVTERSEKKGWLVFLDRILRERVADQDVQELLLHPIDFVKRRLMYSSSTRLDRYSQVCSDFRFYQAHFEDYEKIYSFFFSKLQKLVDSQLLPFTTLFAVTSEDLSRSFLHFSHRYFPEGLQKPDAEQPNYGGQIRALYDKAWQEIRAEKRADKANSEVAQLHYKAHLERKMVRAWSAFVNQEKASRAPVETDSSITIRDEHNKVTISVLKIAQNEKLVSRAVSEKLQADDLLDIQFEQRVLQWMNDDKEAEVLEAEGYLDSKNQKYFALYDSHLDDEEKRRRISVRHSLPFELTQHLHDYGFVGCAKNEQHMLINLPIHIAFDNSDHHESGFLQVVLEPNSDGDGFVCYHWFFKPGAQNELLHAILFRGLESMRWNQLVDEVGIEQAVLFNMFDN